MGRNHRFSLLVALCVMQLFVLACGSLPLPAGLSIVDVARIGATPGPAYAAPSPTPPPASLSAAGLVRKRGKLIVGVRFDAPPLSSVNAAGELEGLDIDLAREFSRRWLGSPDKVEFSQVTSASALRRVASREIDMAMGGLVQTRAGELQVDWSLPYLVDGDALLVRTGAITNTAGLARKNVVYIDLENTASLRTAPATSGFTVSLKSLASYPAAYQLLRSGGADAVIGKWRRLRLEAATNPGVSVLDVLLREPVAVALPQGDLDWAALVNATLSDQIADGGFGSLYAKWFKSPPPTSQRLETAQVTFAGLPDTLVKRDSIPTLAQTRKIRVGYVSNADPLAYAIREQAKPRLRELDPAGEMPGADLDMGVFAGRDAALEERFGQTLRAPGGAQEDEGLSRRLLEVFSKVLEVAAILGGRPGADVDRGLGGCYLVKLGSFGSRQIAANDVRVHEGFEGPGGLGVVGVEIGVELRLDVQRPLHLGEHGFGIDDHEPVRRQDLRDGETRPALGHTEGQEDHLIDLVAAPLGRGIELAETVDAIAEELDPERPEAAGREDVDDPAPARERSRFDHRVLPPVAGAVQVFEQHVHQKLLADAHGQALAVDDLGSGNGVDEGGGRDQNRPHRAILQGQRGLGALVVLGRRSRPRDPGWHVRKGRERSLRSEPRDQGFGVAREAFEVFLVGCHEHHKSIGARERNEKSREAEEAGDAAGAALEGRALERQEPGFPVQE